MKMYRACKGALRLQNLALQKHVPKVFTCVKSLKFCCGEGIGALAPGRAKSRAPEAYTLFPRVLCDPRPGALKRSENLVNCLQSLLTKSSKTPTNAQGRAELGGSSRRLGRHLRCCGAVSSIMEPGL